MGVGWGTLPRAKGQRVRVKEGNARSPFRRTVSLHILTRGVAGTGAGSERTGSGGPQMHKPRALTDGRR